VTVGQPEHHDAVAVPDPDRGGAIAQRPAQVGLQQALEVLPVATLEDDLAYLEQHAGLDAGADFCGHAAGHRSCRHLSSVPASWAATVRRTSRIGGTVPE